VSTTLWQLVERRTKNAPDSTAVLFETNRISNRQFFDRALSLARGLADLGVGPGDVVAVQLPNIPEYLLSYAAICALGATLQPVHMPYRRAELNHLLGHSGAQVFISATRPEGIEGVKHVVPLGERFAALAACAPLERPRKGSPDETRSSVINPHRLAGAVDHLKIPTLLVRGRSSDLLSEDGAADFRRRVPHAEYADVAGAGHMVAGDRNEVFNRAILDFLERHRSDG